MKQRPVPLSFIQRKAKQLKKENPSLAHHQALDEAAKSFGHTNYQNYKNEYEAYDNWLSAELELGADYAMSEQAEKMAEKRSLLVPIFENHNVPVHQLIDTFKNTTPVDEQIQLTCEKDLSIKKFIELFLLKDFLEDIDLDLITFAPYHIPDQASSKNLIYKYGKDEFDEVTDEEVLLVEGEFEIVCKIMFAHTQEDIDSREDGFFNDRILSGYFELTIDKDKNVSIVNLDVGSNW